MLLLILTFSAEPKETPACIRRQQSTRSPHTWLYLRDMKGGGHVAAISQILCAFCRSTMGIDP